MNRETFADHGQGESMSLELHLRSSSHLSQWRFSLKCPGYSTENSVWTDWALEMAPSLLKYHKSVKSLLEHKCLFPALKVKYIALKMHILYVDNTHHSMSKVNFSWRANG